MKKMKIPNSKCTTPERTPIALAFAMVDLILRRLFVVVSNFRGEAGPKDRIVGMLSMKMRSHYVYSHTRAIFVFLPSSRNVLYCFLAHKESYKGWEKPIKARSGLSVRRL